MNQTVNFSDGIMLEDELTDESDNILTDESDDILVENKFSIVFIVKVANNSSFDATFRNTETFVIGGWNG